MDFAVARQSWSLICILVEPTGFALCNEEHTERWLLKEFVPVSGYAGWNRIEYRQGGCAMFHRIRVHRIHEDGELEYHFEQIADDEWPRFNAERGGYYSTDTPDALRQEIGEGLAFSAPEPGALLTLFVDTSFGFAGGSYGSDEEVAVEMAKHVLLCHSGCQHRKHTELAY